MEPKKHPKADLESKRFSFFLFGIALSLIAVIIIFQHQTSFSKPPVDKEPVIEISTIDIPITVRDELEKPKQKDVNPETPIVDPEPEPKLDVNDLLGDDSEKDEPDEGLADIGRDDGDDLDEIETLKPMMIQRLARPVECESLDDRDAQLQCLNKWIGRYVSAKVRYPKRAKDLNQYGTVYVTFIIDENGYVDKVKVERPEYQLLDEEAKRVIEALPRFIPGGQNGRKVRMQMTVPINFKQM